MQNTNCYKDYILYETLDRCSHDAFSIGPMSFCDKKLNEIKKSSPDTLSFCAKDYLDGVCRKTCLFFEILFQKTSKNWTCESSRALGDCLLPEVKKYCDLDLLPLFKEISTCLSGCPLLPPNHSPNFQHQDHRQYYLGCDGRLKFDDLETTPSTNNNNSTGEIVEI
ncbi:hypothetical protein CRE_08949 [Caenorhabditis remanei]|uniref:Uncharacterized protein n=1 Tax=Caenorhabditis remanei TaxID=31234 RepID=E3LIF0_CAERE|nr:hypothetical protein CRE_08949 [Caenorhabditis remanei]